MDTKDGRVADATGLSQAEPKVSALTGFDPSRDELPIDLDRERFEGKPRRLPNAEQAALESFIEDIRTRLGSMSESELSTVILACLNVSPINCWCIAYAIAEVVYPFAAEAMELRRDSDGSPKGEDADAASSETTARAEGIANLEPEPGQ